ncbi:MAG: GNAT family N-acetyltransferase [Desulfobacula sp.]|nr:GNAT family N-acetyltransferase [Desulfobacula sp.]
MFRDLVLKAFFELGTQRVMGTAMAVNNASIRVMEKAGMKLEKKLLYKGMESRNQNEASINNC